MVVPRASKPFSSHRSVMTPLLAGALLVALAACGSDAPPATTAPAATLTPTITSLPVVTAAPPTTSTVATTAPPTTVLSTLPPIASTTFAAPTTTVGRGAALVLRDNSVGDAVFGADPDQVVAYVTSILGAPTSDSGWIEPSSAFGVCPGTEVRGVTFGDLTLLFSDDSPVTSGRRHFFAYRFGPAFGPTIDPAGPRTAAGIGVGSSIDDLIAAYPDIVIEPANEAAAATFTVNDNLGGFLSGDGAEDVVTAIEGGQRCGE